MLNRDGKPYIHRKPTPAEDIRRCMNPAIASHKTVVRSLAQGLKLPYGLTQRSEDDLKKASKPLDPNELCQKLNELQQKQDAAKQCTLNSRQLSDKLTSVAQPRVFSQVDFDDDQAILDKHVSRVFSPGMSPGTSSPKHFHRHTHRPHDSSNFIPEFGKPNTVKYQKYLLTKLKIFLFSCTSNATLKINSGACSYGAAQ